MDPDIARSESSASTSVRVQTIVRSTTEGPIAPNRLGCELADSRRESVRLPSRSAMSRHAEPVAQAGMPAATAARDVRTAP